MLAQVVEGVWVHQSPLLQNNSVVVQGRDGVLLVDPGITRDEMTCLADDIRGLGQTVVAGFATHPHWDHVLWTDELGGAPRHGTAACAEVLREQMADPDWLAKEIEDLPPEIVDDVPMELYGLITGLPAGADRVPWDGPEVRIIEHSAHERGHAALLVDRVLVAGDMLSDILMPFPSPQPPIRWATTSPAWTRSRTSPTTSTGSSRGTDQWVQTYVPGLSWIARTSARSRQARALTTRASGRTRRTARTGCRASMSGTVRSSVPPRRSPLSVA